MFPCIGLRPSAASSRQVEELASRFASLHERTTRIEEAQLKMHARLARVEASVETNAARIDSADAAALTLAERMTKTSASLSGALGILQDAIGRMPRTGPEQDDDDDGFSDFEDFVAN